MRPKLVTLALIALALLLMPAVIANAAGPVEMVIFFSPACSHCAAFEAEVVPRLQQEFGHDLAVRTVDVTTADGLAELEAAEQRAGVTVEYLPIIQLGEQLYSDEDVFGLEEPLRAAISVAVATERPTAGGMVPLATAANPSGATSAAAQLHVAYITRSGCEDCARAAIILDVMRQEFGGLQVRTFDHVTDADLVEAMGRSLGLSAERRLIAPSFYVGSTALVGDEINSTNVRDALSQYAEAGAPPPWEGLDAASGRQSIIDRFQRMGPLAVVLAGLIDGINPCAFATIIFFASYLAISRRPRRDLIIVGLAFALGVFITYLMVGLGAMSLLSLMSSIRWLGQALYTLMAAACLALAVISLHDLVQARRGRLHDMKLNLPDRMRERIKGRIRAASGAYVGAAFVSGLIVSLMELACTGQVYLPTISFMVGIPEMRGRAVLYLVLYNLMFIVPLIAVLLLTAYGTSAVRFQDWFTKHAALAKGIMAVLFLLLGALLVAQVLSM